MCLCFCLSLSLCDVIVSMLTWRAWANTSGWGHQPRLSSVPTYLVVHAQWSAWSSYQISIMNIKTQSCECALPLLGVRVPWDQFFSLLNWARNSNHLTTESEDKRKWKHLSIEYQILEMGGTRILRCKYKQGVSWVEGKWLYMRLGLPPLPRHVHALRWSQASWS